MFALTAFVVAVVAGVWSGRDVASILGRALTAMIICWPLSWIVVRLAVGASVADPRSNGGAQGDESARGAGEATTNPDRAMRIADEMAIARNSRDRLTRREPDQHAGTAQGADLESA